MVRKASLLEKFKIQPSVLQVELENCCAKGISHLQPCHSMQILEDPGEMLTLPLSCKGHEFRNSG